MTTGPDSSVNCSVEAGTAGVGVEEQEIQFLPVNPTQHQPKTFDYRTELTRVASEISQRIPSTSAARGSIADADALAGVEPGDPALDPTALGFDVYKWANMVLRAADKASVQFRRASFSFNNLNVSGSGPALNFQSDVASVFMLPFRLGEYVKFGKKPEKKILSNFDGVIKPGEMILVLGGPGSGCSTFLKTMAGELHGLNVSKTSVIHYSGISQKEMTRNFNGEIVYNSEVDNHFPHLTVKQTLEFAATVRTPQNHIVAVSRKDNIQHVTAVVTAICGLTRAQNTRVGNDYVRGVSGGERKRVSIAEMILASAAIGCWDNSTRGLDSATALQFVQSLRMTADILGTTHAVAIYQASQAIYEVFDKVTVLYEGREIYFGPGSAAKAYFEEMGWYCQPRQTTGDFLTAVTNHLNRKPREGYEARVPRTSADFEKHWRASGTYKSLLDEIEQHASETLSTAAADEFKATHRAVKAHHTRPKSPYIVSIPMQLRMCMKRAYQRSWNDKISTLTVVVGQVIMALIVGSVFYGAPNNTDSFFARGSTLFFATLLSALIAVTEIHNLYQQRPIIEKQASYAYGHPFASRLVQSSVLTVPDHSYPYAYLLCSSADFLGSFCHPFVEALAGMISDAPVKLIVAVCFNLTLYFLAGLNSEPAQFFIFFLFTILVRFTMSAIFRTVGAATKTIPQALAISGVLVLAMVIYTGYTIPRPYMHPWFKWLSYINPLAYAFEALMVNEFHGREFPCASFVPSYPNISGATFICPVAGAVAGQLTVSGDAYIEASFQYSYSHIWRDLGIIIGFWIFFFAAYLIATELNSSQSSAADVLLFRRGRALKGIVEAAAGASCINEKGDSAQAGAVQGESQKQEIEHIQSQRGIFTWRDIVYDIYIKDEPRRLLDHVSGWVRPGILTALMGVSGAGKTTLLDVLAQRTSVGVVTGDMLVNGKSLDSSFQRKTGYVQQQDIHLETSTVREALRFSAMLRQPKSVSNLDKCEYVEMVIRTLNMEDFAEAVVGVPGEGLNVEQRKLLTIGVELAAKPALLLFLDEPTSGLDSQSSLTIIRLLRKLADNGQVVLATIHQPSSILFEEFDQLLFLAKGGRTVYFGEIGENSRTLLDYFESHGARPCEESENPAEYILEIVTAGASGKTGLGRQWPEIWQWSQESRKLKLEQDRIHEDMESIRSREASNGSGGEFAVPLYTQLRHTTVRVFQQYWRTPSYIWGKILLGGISALFIGFSFFESINSIQGLQNVVFSIFMMTSILSSLVQQIMPRFVAQRSLFEARERPSKICSWIAFLLANVIVEMIYQIVLGILVFGCYYYPIFGIQSSERQGLVLLFCIQYFIFAGTFAHLVIVALPDAQTAGAVTTLLFSLTMIFNGVFQPPQALPGFWIFMYRVSPLTYIVDGIAATGLFGRPVQCSTSEIHVFPPLSGLTCGNYLQNYLTQAFGQLLNPASTSYCQYCPLSNANQFLAISGISWSTRWRNVGIVWAYIAFNVIMAMALYYTFRVKNWSWTNRKRPLLTVLYWFQQAGYYTRALLVGYFEKSPSTKEGANFKLY